LNLFQGGGITFYQNNFDIIRLLAAFQVALVHVTHHFNVPLPHFLGLFVDLFPGVPIFFFTSGFLISKSFEINSELKIYGKKRILRIYPALVVCSVLSLCSVFMVGYFEKIDVSAVKIAVHAVAQSTFFQFYNPEYMRHFGTGVLNGSLWTITVELQFYFLVPILYRFLGVLKTERRNLGLIALTVLFALIYLAHWPLRRTYGDETIFKLWSVTFAPWVWMFLVGMLCQRNFTICHRFLKGRFLLALLFYVVWAYFGTRFLGWTTNNRIDLPLFLPLAALVFASAYSLPLLSEKVLHRNDISYGIYIYHVPVINVMLYQGYSGRGVHVAITIVLTIIAAAASWFLVERNFLKLKRTPKER